MKTLTFALALAALIVIRATPSAQSPASKVRLNPVIAALEAGQPAISGETWQFTDMEHGPYSPDRVATVLGEAGKERDGQGRMKRVPLIRIPTEGDDNFKWIIKQVLDSGAFGVVLPHVDTAEEALRFVKAMRYPRERGSKIAEPRGERGWGPGRALKYWGLANDKEYYAKSDVWPLNPDGELFGVAMIESADGVKNINAILKTPGLSAILVVPGDMSIDLGLGPRGPQPFPEVEAAFQAVAKACRANKNVVCGLGDARSNMKKRMDEGWRMMLPLGG